MAKPTPEYIVLFRQYMRQKHYYQYGIAKKCGYASEAAFCRALRAELPMNPRMLLQITVILGLTAEEATQLWYAAGYALGSSHPFCAAAQEIIALSYDPAQQAARLAIYGAGIVS